MDKEKLSWTLGGGGSDVGGVRALTVSDIGVVFQPIVDMKTGATFAHEALVRCRRPEYMAPPVLFEHAVKENACGRLGRLIREVAFQTSGDVPLFVNLHPDELSSRWLVRPDDPLCFHAAPVFLEITESAAFTHFQLCLSVLRELCRRTGALLVVDDFGAGHSNLERVVDLEPSIVKLDLALTRGIDAHPRRRAVVRHVVNLCNELGARVVAEGIETVDELSCVRDLGVDYAQGYLLARPAAPPPKVAWPFHPKIKLPPPLPITASRVIPVPAAPIQPVASTRPVPSAPALQAEKPAPALQAATPPALQAETAQAAKPTPPRPKPSKPPRPGRPASLKPAKRTSQKPSI
jgi:EAL domain-containing protein (putative c-di-GMP-specific phosphodiesterase class I)